MNKKIMKKVKSKWVVATVFTAMVGISAFAPMEASAAEWNARTPQQIEITDRSHYDIVWGDTLWAISEASNVSVEALVEINHIANRDLILAGNYLVIEGNVVSVTQQNGQTDSFKVEGNTVTPVETSAKPVVNHENTTSKNETVVETPKAPATQAPVVVAPEVKPEVKPETPVVTPEVKPEADNGESGNFAPSVDVPEVETPDAETPDVDVPVTPAPEEVPMTPIEPSTPVTPEEVPMTPIEPSTPVTPEVKPEEKPEVKPETKPNISYSQVASAVSGGGFNFQIDEDGEVIVVSYDTSVGSVNQNIPDSLFTAYAHAKKGLNNAGIKYEIYEGGPFFMLTIYK